MDPIVKEKWLVALRSGKYKQGQSRLCNEQNEYCCLGVLAEVMQVPKTLSNDVCYNKKSYAYFFPSEIDGYTASVPSNILSNSIQHILWDMNDTYKQDFNQIANYIEENL